jgi:hypothetical protein
VDSASDLGIFFRIVIPLPVPAIASLAIVPTLKLDALQPLFSQYCSSQEHIAQAHLWKFMELSRKDAKNAKEPINLCDFAALRDISLCNILLTSTLFSQYYGGFDIHDL